MIEILLYIANCFVMGGYIYYILFVLFNYNKSITNSNGFNIIKDILHEYDSINIIENKSIFTIYNIKRGVIKIASKCYYGSSVSAIGIPLMEAGISAIDDKHNKYINLFRKIISNLKYLYILPIVASIVNGLTFNIGDAKIAIVLLIVFSIISYILIDIKSNAALWIVQNIKKVKKIESKEIIRFINNIVLCDKLIFLGELMMIIRLVAILLKMT